MSKLKLDQTGTKHDSNFRLKNVRTYLYDYVQIARDAVYRLAAAIARVVVNRLLKATSSVPTVVRSRTDLGLLQSVNTPTFS